MFGRQIRSKLDLMIPQKKFLEVKTNTLPKFKVAARNYFSTKMSQFYTVLKVLGKQPIYQKPVIYSKFISSKI